MDACYDRERIEKLRESAVQSTLSYREFYYHFYKAMREIAGQKPYELRYADALCASFERTEPVIEEGEWIVGRISNRPFSPEE